MHCCVPGCTELATDFGVCSQHAVEAQRVIAVSDPRAIEEIRREVEATRPSYQPGEWIPPTGDTTVYGARALQSIIAKFEAQAGESYKNTPLRAAAFTAGTLVGAGEIAMSDAESALVQAGERVGHHPVDVKITVRRGLRDGAKSPRKRQTITTSAPRMGVPRLRAPRIAA